MAPPKPSDRNRQRPRVTGLRLPDELVKVLKHLAIDTDKTLREAVIEAGWEYAIKRGAKKV